MELVIKGKSYNLPIFMPDATHASIKGVDSLDLQNTGTLGVVTNTYHLLTDGIVETIERAGGLKKFMNFDGLVVTDSGGFQAMSLIRKNATNGKLTDYGVTFKNPASGKTLHLTPESCIETQFMLGSDIIMALDDCTDPRESEYEQEISVKRTIAWAKRCKKQYIELTKNLKTNERPLLFGIIQGGDSKKLRKLCAENLINMGFDGFSYGGWPMNGNGLLHEILEFTAKLMPDNLPKYAMGVGKPSDIVDCYKMGYNMFDCVIPTRDARHARLYVIDKDKVETLSKVGTLNIGNEKYANDFTSVSSNCGCYTCKNFSKSYLRHLYKVGEPVFYKLATIHNIYTYNKVINGLK